MSFDVSSSEEYDSSEDELKRDCFPDPAKEENSIPSSKEDFVPPDFEIKDEKDFYRKWKIKFCVAVSNPN